MATTNSPSTEPPSQVQPALTSTTEATPTNFTTSDPRIPYPFSLPSSTPPFLIAQGAEALLYRTTYLSSDQPAALKVRPSKKYRHKTLDERLTKQRVLAEARVLVRLAGVDNGAGEWTVPAVYGVEWDVARRVKGLRKGAGTVEERETDKLLTTRARGNESNGAWLLMEWIEGLSVKELVRRWDAWARQTDEAGKPVVTEEEKQDGEKEFKRLLQRIGRAVAGMHSKGSVVHGDLTSSNLLVRRVGLQAEQTEPAAKNTDATERIPHPDLSGEVVLIDFGLAIQSVQDEDRAVDLYVLERAFGSTHPRQEQWFDREVLQSQAGYRGAWKGAAVVLKKLEDVRLRGRKRSMIG